MKKMIFIISLIVLPFLLTSCGGSGVNVANSHDVTVYQAPSTGSRIAGATSNLLRVVGNAQYATSSGGRVYRSGSASTGGSYWKYTSHQGRRVRVDMRSGRSYYHTGSEWRYFKTISVPRSASYGYSSGGYRGSSSYYPRSTYQPPRVSRGPSGITTWTGRYGIAGPINLPKAAYMYNGGGALLTPGR